MRPLLIGITLVALCACTGERPRKRSAGDAASSVKEPAELMSRVLSAEDLTLPQADSLVAREPALGVPAITYDSQQTDSWCWAASAEMILKYLGVRPPPSTAQCDQATNDLGAGHDCCDNRYMKSIGCTLPGYPNWGRFGLTAHSYPKVPLPWDTIRTEISRWHRPLLGSEKVIGMDDHAFVVYGFAANGGSPVLYVTDPYPKRGPHTILAYGEYVRQRDKYLRDDFHLVKADPTNAIGSKR